MNNVAMAQVVQKAAKPKFRGHTTLKSKVVTHYPDNIAREYVRVTNTYMAMLNKVLAKRLPDIRRAIDADREDNARRDDERDIKAMVAAAILEMKTEFDKMAVGFGLKEKLEYLGKMTQSYTIREWKRVVQKTLGIDIMEDYYKGEFFRETMGQWVATNVSLIKTIPNDALSEMQDIIIKGYTSGRSNTSMGRDIQEAYGQGRRHAQFIARDQVAKLNGEMTRAQQKDAGVEEYIWSDSGDGRVRDRHRDLNGTPCKWDDPPIVDLRTGRRAHPGEDYRCRCVALPIFNLPGLDLPWEKG